VYVGTTFSAIGTSNTLGNLYTTGGNVGINNTSPQNALDVTGTLSATLITTSNIGVTNITGVNAVFDSMSAGSIFLTSISTSNVEVTSLTATNAIITNSSLSNVTVTNLLATNASVSSAIITDLSSSNSVATDASASNLTVTAGTIAGLASTTISVGTAYIDVVTTGSLNVVNSTFTNILATNITSSTLYVNNVEMTPTLGDIITEKTFSASNNVASPSPVTGFTFGNTVRAFDANLSITILATSGNEFALYNLRGINISSGWLLNNSFIGDKTGVKFSIDTSGSILYTSTNIPSFVSNTMKFEARALSV
jgi:hypothetical protein